MNSYSMLLTGTKRIEGRREVQSPDWLHQEIAETLRMASAKYRKGNTEALARHASAHSLVSLKRRGNVMVQPAGRVCTMLLDDLPEKWLAGSIISDYGEQVLNNDTLDQIENITQSRRRLQGQPEVGVAIAIGISITMQTRLEAFATLAPPPSIAALDGSVPLLVHTHSGDVA